MSQNTLPLNWHMKAEKLQKDVAYERQQSQIGYREQGEYDYTSALKDNSEEFKKPVNWISVKQQFFNTTLIAKNNFSSGTISWKAPVETDTRSIVDATANMKLSVAESGFLHCATCPLLWSYGL
jgi:YidC/Oxa1 family membrane protein insertase